jgi:microcystin-dependent protein
MVNFYQSLRTKLFFALLGTTYGGNGISTFALPDMRGRVLVHNGQAPGGPTIYSMGQTGGVESVTLTVTQMPAHNHTVNAVTAEGTKVHQQTICRQILKGLTKNILILEQIRQ